MDESSTNEDEPRSERGCGSITYDARRQRWRLRIRRNEGGVQTDVSKYFDSEEEAKLTRRALAMDPDLAVGITLRQWGEIWLSEHDYSASIPATWYSVVQRSAPFIDAPLTTITSQDVAGWAAVLERVKRTRSELVGGKRTLVTLTECISREYAKQALSILRSCLDAAKNRAPQLITENPAASVELPSVKNKLTGRIRTKAVQRSRSKIDALPQSDCDRIFYCVPCEQRSGLPRHDIEQLVVCEHLPFMYRVALSCSVMQGLRQGEIAAQRWERIAVDGMAEHEWRTVQWAERADWTGHVWLVAASWDDDTTKNGQTRIQALIPMAARLLHRWWEHKGRPQTGLLFSKADAMSKGQPLGELALFVARHSHHSNRDLLREAERCGVRLTLRRIETLRSEARKRAARKAELATQMFARGYDFGWSDTPDNSRPRPGWITKLGIERRRRFHDFRDTAASHLLSGSWGERWSVEDVSDFIGHSDVKVTKERYASLLTEAKTRLAAGIQPCRLTASEPHPPEPRSGRQVAAGSLEGSGLSGGNLWAPEPGLEPGTTRLTEDGASPDSAQLGHSAATSRPVLERIVERLLDAAKPGATLSRSALLELAAAVQRAADGEPALTAEPATPSQGARLRVVK